MDFTAWINQAKDVKELPILDNGDYRVRICAFYVDSVQNYERVNFRIEYENRGECIPNKIVFLFPTQNSEPEKMRDMLLRYRSFARCFGLNPDNADLQPENFLNRTGKIKVSEDKNGYKNVSYFYQSEFLQDCNPKQFVDQINH